GVVLTELPRLGGARLRCDAAESRDADRVQPAHPCKGWRTRARDDSPLAAVGAAHRAVRCRVNPCVHRSARHGDTTDARRMAASAPGAVVRWSSGARATATAL